MKNIILIGMPGCGKSTLGRRLAEALHRSFVDADTYLEEKEGKQYIKYTDELTNAVNKYNDNLESIAQRILNLKIEFNDKDIEVRNLYGLLNKLSVVNSIKSRKETEQLLENVITEYGYMLEVFRDTGKLP